MHEMQRFPVAKRLKKYITITAFLWGEEEPGPKGDERRGMLAHPRNEEREGMWGRTDLKKTCEVNPYSSSV